MFEVKRWRSPMEEDHIVLCACMQPPTIVCLFAIDGCLANRNRHGC